MSLGRLDSVIDHNLIEVGSCSSLVGDLEGELREAEKSHQH